VGEGGITSEKSGSAASLFIQGSPRKVPGSLSSSCACYSGVAFRFCRL
jgi:hypothetical protein